MNIKTIQKYKKKSIPQLKKIAEKHFNRFIRERDMDECCISCGAYNVKQAGHFFSGGNYPNLKFNENNVNGQCVKCNYYLSGNLLEYRKNLIDKIGIDEVENLEFLAQRYKQTGYKWDRYFLIEIIEKYKNS